MADPTSLTLQSAWRLFCDAPGRVVEIYVIDNPASVLSCLQGSTDYELQVWLKDQCGNITAIWHCTSDETVILHDEFHHGSVANLSIKCASFDELAHTLQVMDDHGVKFCAHESYE